MHGGNGQVKAISKNVKGKKRRQISSDKIQDQHVTGHSGDLWSLRDVSSGSGLAKGTTVAQLRGLCAQFRCIKERGIRRMSHCIQLSTGWPS